RGGAGDLPREARHDRPGAAGLLDAANDRPGRDAGDAGDRPAGAGDLLQRLHTRQRRQPALGDRGPCLRAQAIPAGRPAARRAGRAGQVAPRTDAVAAVERSAVTAHSSTTSSSRLRATMSARTIRTRLRLRLMPVIFEDAT